MNELDLARRAKSYLDALALGIDPLSGRPAPPGDMLQQERLRRCFQYVSGVLEKVIAAQSAPAGRASPEETAAPPFVLPAYDHTAAVHAVLEAADLANAVSYSQEPISLVAFWSAVCRDHLSPLGLRSVMTQRMLDWLAAKGLFSQPVTREGAAITEKGRALGLSARMNGEEGKKHCVCYGGEPLQRMIVENLEEFILWDQEQWDLFLSCVRDSAFPYSSKPVSITALAKQINALASGCTSRRVTHELILRWLIREGAMQEVEKGPGSKARVPTPQGNALGIVTHGVIREGRASYNAHPQYNASAQRFIVCHLPQIVDAARFLPVL